MTRRPAAADRNRLGIRPTTLEMDGLVQGHVRDFDLQPLRSAAGEKLLHVNAYYPLNEIPHE